jgi:hypothetical protein
MATPPMIINASELGSGTEVKSKRILSNVRLEFTPVTKISKCVIPLQPIEGSVTVFVVEPPGILIDASDELRACHVA